MDIKRICENQRKEIEKYKWIKGQEVRYDPGMAAAVEWVEKYASEYRKEYEEFFQSYVKEVAERTISDITKIHNDMTQMDLEPIIRIIIEKFTEIWAIDMATSKKKHLDEI